jgi:Protein of unknown function (DUF2997)
MAKVHVTIDPKTGTASFEVEGVAGGKCTDITNALTAGKQILDQQYTSEYCMPEVLPDYIETSTEE